MIKLYKKGTGPHLEGKAVSDFNFSMVRLFPSSAEDTALPPELLPGMMNTRQMAKGGELTLTVQLKE